MSLRYLRPPDTDDPGASLCNGGESMSETRFEVGTRAKVGDAIVKIAFGPYSTPYNSERYIVAHETGRFAGKSLSTESHRLTALPKFEVGDRVTTGGTQYTVKAGPFNGARSPFYVLTSEAGTDSFAVETWISPIVEAVAESFKVGDRVRVVRDDPGYRTGEFVGQAGIVSRLSGNPVKPYEVRFDNRAIGRDNTGYWWCAELEKIQAGAGTHYAHNGVSYDLSSAYVDRTNDVWYFTSVPRADGEPTVTMHSSRRNSEGVKLSAVVRDWGPLRKCA